jgi:glutathione peroxidase
MYRMKVTLCVAGCCLMAVTACGGGASPTNGEKPTAAAAATVDHTKGIIDFTVESLSGETVDLSMYRGRPMLIVNTASKCGYTPQYEGLQKLYERYGDRGLVVIGFPSNDFGNQEPGSAGEIANFCRLNYGVTFPMMAKVHTKGPEQAPIYRSLTGESAEEFRGEIKWNFTKFLIDPEGRVVARFEPSVEPLDERITSAIEELLSLNHAPGH